MVGSLESAEAVTDSRRVRTGAWRVFDSDGVAIYAVIQTEEEVLVLCWNRVGDDKKAGRAVMARTPEEQAAYDAEEREGNIWWERVGQHLPKEMDRREFAMYSFACGRLAQKLTHRFEVLQGGADAQHVAAAFVHQGGYPQSTATVVTAKEIK